MAFINIASVPKYLDEVKALLVGQHLDLLAVNETRLCDEISDSEVSISGYNIIRRDRSRHGGGTALFVRDSINYTIRDNLFDKSLETVSIEIIKPKSKPFIVSTWYRAPSSPIEAMDLFELGLQKLDSENKEFHILGDTNCDLLHDDPDNNTRRLQDLIQLFQLKQTIPSPTRITAATKTLIDHHITNDEQKLSQTGVVDVCLSDHNMIYAIRKIGIPRGPPKIVESRSYKRMNRNAFIQDLARQPWDSLTSLTDPNLFWQAWEKLFTKVLNKHAPLRKRKIKSQPAPWLTSDIKKAMFQRDYLKKVANRSSDPIDWSRYRTARNQVHLDIKKAKSDYYSARIDSNVDNSKNMWKALNELTSRKKKQTLINQIDLDGLSHTNSADIARALNMHFTQISDKLASENANKTTDTSFEDFITPATSVFQFSPVSVNTVTRLMEKLCGTKSPGLDKIPPKILKMAAPVLSPSLTFLFNLSLETSIFPDEWKRARVTPIFKSGSKSDCNNYRPISVLSVVSKVLERIVYDQVYHYLVSNNLLSKYQSGFRSLHSTVTALLDVTNDWFINMDEGLANCVVFLDIKKAFDTVNHEILLKKLEIYGFNSQVIGWFKSYLHKRSQVCVIGDASSNEGLLTSGVPQGSIVGPLLFLIFINDLNDTTLYSKCKMYADDTSICVPGRTAADFESKINDDLNKMNDWFIANKLNLNTMKSEFMVITNSQRHKDPNLIPVVKIGDSQLKRVSNSKYLGLEIDDRLSWCNHIDKICKKVSSGIGMIKRVRPYVNADTLNTVYKSLVQCHFDYCSPVWADSVGSTLSIKLQRLQNRAARVITKSSYDVRSHSLRQELNWDDLETRRKKHIATMMYKIHHGMCPVYLTETFIPCSQTTSYGLRSVSANNYFMPRPNREYLKKSFSYSGAKLWNQLPSEAKSSTSLPSFKAALSNYF